MFGGPGGYRYKGNETTRNGWHEKTTGVFFFFAKVGRLASQAKRGLAAASTGFFSGSLQMTILKVTHDKNHENSWNKWGYSTFSDKPVWDCHCVAGLDANCIPWGSSGPKCWMHRHHVFTVDPGCYLHTCVLHILRQSYTHVHSCTHLQPLSIHLWVIYQTSIHPYIHTSIHPYIHTSIHPYIHTSIHPYIHTSFYPTMLPYIYACIYIYVDIERIPQWYSPSVASKSDHLTASWWSTVAMVSVWSPSGSSDCQWPHPAPETEKPRGENHPISSHIIIQVAQDFHCLLSTWSYFDQIFMTIGHLETWSTKICVDPCVDPFVDPKKISHVSGWISPVLPRPRWRPWRCAVGSWSPQRSWASRRRWRMEWTNEWTNGGVE